MGRPVRTTNRQPNIQRFIYKVVSQTQNTGSRKYTSCSTSTSRFLFFFQNHVEMQKHSIVNFVGTRDYFFCLYQKCDNNSESTRY